MKVFYDYQIFQEQRFGGISRYFYELIKRNDNYLLPVKYSDNEYLLNDSNFNVLPIPKRKKWNVFNRRESNDELNKRSLARYDQYDLLHPTYFDPYFLDYIGDKPFVLTVHDMITELYPEHFDLDEKIIFWKKQLAEKAARIIAVSNTTKRDLIRFYPHVKDKVDVVYHGCSFLYDSEVKINLPNNYILFVGNRTIYKNFYFLVEAIQTVLLKSPDLYLICTGPSFTSNELAFFEKLGLGKKVIHFFANESTLFSFYKYAKLFIYPSLYEGFGIPILEAFKAGCPVLLSKTDAFVEVAGDASLFFDPKDPASLRESVIELLSNEKLKQGNVERGREVEKKFSWDLTYEQTYQVYQKALNQ